MENKDDQVWPKFQELVESGKKIVDLLQLLVLTKDSTSLCQGKNKIVCWWDNAAFEAANFVFSSVLFVSM